MLFLFLFNSILSNAQINECYITWYKDGVKQTTPDYISVGQTYTLKRDPGTAVNISVWPTSSVSGSRTYYLVDWSNGIFDNSGETTQGYWYFDNKVGSVATEIWLFVNNQGTGLIKIMINNYVPPKPDLTITSVTFDNSTQLNNYKSGDVISISCRVDNNGNGIAHSNYLGIYLGNSSTDFSNRITSKSISQLNGLTGIYITYKYTFTDNDIGTKYFLFKADYSNVVSEQSESNNTTYRGPFSVNEIPLAIDLTEPTTELTVMQGQLITISWKGSGSGATSVSLRRDDDNVWENGTNEVWIASFQPVSGSFVWDTKNVPPGNYYIAIALFNTSTLAYKYSPGIITINPMTGNVTVNVKNIDGTGSPLPGSEGRVKLFNSVGTQIGNELSTNSSGQVTFNNIPVGSNYYYEVYHEPLNPTTPFGREYWGIRTGLTITTSGVNEDFTRNQPYLGNIKILNNGVDVTGQSVNAGTQLTVEYGLINPSSTMQSAKGRIFIDNDKTNPIDFIVEGDLQQIPANNSIKQTKSFTPIEAGVLYVAGGADISTNNSNPNYTDGGIWSSNPFININSSTLTTELLLPPDGGTGTLPFNFSGKPGTLVRIEACLYRNVLGLLLLKLDNKSIRFEVQFNSNSSWFKIP